MLVMVEQHSQVINNYAIHEIKKNRLLYVCREPRPAPTSLAEYYLLV